MRLGCNAWNPIPNVRDGLDCSFETNAQRPVRQHTACPGLDPFPGTWCNPFQELFAYCLLHTKSHDLWALSIVCFACS